MASLPATALPPTLEVGGACTPDDAGASGTVTYALIHMTDENRNVTFTPADEVCIGRDKTTCKLAYPECAVMSRLHCKVFSLGRDVFLHDHSSNGTFLNGKVMGKDVKKALRAGDVVATVGPKMPEHSLYSWKFVPPPSTEEENTSTTGVTSQYELGPVLGTGNFATVRLGTHRVSGKQFAVKIIEKKRMAMQTDFSFSSLLSEVEILRKMQHPNIIGVVDVFDDERTFTMVLELVAGGDLFDYIVGRGTCPFTEAEAKVLFVQLLEAMLYMHNKDVVHRDLKPENILVAVKSTFTIPNKSSDNQKNAKSIPVTEVDLKITDFGLAKFCTEQDVMTTMCGTPSYLAPEVLTPSGEGQKRAAGYGWTVDVWSLGVILYILLSGTPPKNPQGGVVVFNKYFANVSEDVRRLIQHMLTVDPKHRADLSDICSCKWLKGVEIKNRDLAVKKDRLMLEGTVMMQASPTMQVQPELPGNETDKEDSEDDIAEPPTPAKRNKTEKVVWYWKGDLDKLDEDESAWKPYSQVDIENIERNHKKNTKSCKIGAGEYRISFEGMFQYHKLDTSKQRPVKRVLVA